MGNKASTPVELPRKMKRIVLVEPNPDMAKVKIEIQEDDVPQLQSGQVLIRVVGAPVNPSDFGAWRTKAPETKPGEKQDPVYLGKEGCGIVIASGGGMKANGLVGQKVGFCRIENGGSYQEYVAADAMKSCYPLPADCPVADAASFFVNPYTAVGIMATVREVGSPGFVHTAAASQLGQMFVKLCKEENMPLINVVRREDQAKTLRAIGAKHVVVSSQEGWKEELAKLIEETKITCAFDAISGESTGEILSVMPPKSTTFVYGGLSEKPISGIHPLDLIYRGKQLQGWLLPNWIAAASGGMVGMVMRVNNASKIVNPGLATGWSSSQFIDVAPEDFWKKFLDMRNGEGFTNKKLRIRWMTENDLALEKGATTTQTC